MRVPLVADLNLYNFRVQKLAEHRAAEKRDRAWLADHPKHRLREHVEKSLAEHEAGIKRLEALLRECEVTCDWDVNPYDDKDSFRCMVCGGEVCNSNGVTFGRHVHLECVGAFKKGEKG